MWDHSERRHHIRMNLDCEVIYKYPESDQEYNGRCINLSGSGVLFTTYKEVDLGIALEINIIPENSMTPPMHAYVEVIRCQFNEIDRTYHVAAEIKGIKDS